MTGKYEVDRLATKVRLASLRLAICKAGSKGLSYPEMMKALHVVPKMENEGSLYMDTTMAHVWGKSWMEKVVPEVGRVRVMDRTAWSEDVLIQAIFDFEDLREDVLGKQMGVSMALYVAQGSVDRTTTPMLAVRVAAAARYRERFGGGSIGGFAWQPELLEERATVLEMRDVLAKAVKIVDAGEGR